ncbi:hypothetical protein LTR10_002692 [Elasticomyces elasticus]|nr:hypothetical protein LTR10_002692 [Elasticomyces elasticus]KAK4967966.1 hypothetical protein LTR42_010294 [Elasticomyces elasticus]
MASTQSFFAKDKQSMECPTCADFHGRPVIQGLSERSPTSGGTNLWNMTGSYQDFLGDYGRVVIPFRDLWRTAATGCITCGILADGLRLALQPGEPAVSPSESYTGVKPGGLDANLDRYELQYFDYDDDTLLLVRVSDLVDYNIRAEFHFYVPRGTARVLANE